MREHKFLLQGKKKKKKAFGTLYIFLSNVSCANVTTPAICVLQELPLSPEVVSGVHPISQKTFLDDDDSDREMIFLLLLLLHGFFGEFSR